MKKLLTTILFFCTVLSGFAQNNSLKYMSFNIRYNTPHDKENAWPNRKDWVADIVKFYEVDVFGAQEVLEGQLNDLKDRLPQMTQVGVGRDDGKKAGEFSPIFFNTKEFKLLDSGTFWLSETPDEPSSGWDAALPRICTWAKLKSKSTKRTILVMNCHYDHEGDEARVNSSKLLIKKSQELSEQGKYPVVLMGDFNTEPQAEPIKILSDYYQNTREISLTNPLGPVGTWQGFDYNSPLDSHIDFVFTYGYFKVLRYAHITEAKNQRFPSDHLPVFVELQ
ncbi:endonuclease/exonuclease/phosphatase family protein [Flammeovirga sp. MY04]|uniref:endonuclease/exonuclease/phosphatase family protein n=1 Tax=Flammeovirga sp. MY04 TaxID=1191459 RepID=UPI0008064404|nr:endonuclease/exonuclease/phosphatase family protein [Flammeovirga sp. MY04]ANQ47948.1 endonuclease/exonuclease/phosphatase family protein [Flammeovirga sp. MY04]